MFHFLKKYSIYILIFTILLGIRIYAIHTKNYLFMDAPYSFIASTPNNKLESGNTFKTDWDKYNFQKNKTYKLTEIKRALFTANSNPKSIIKDIYSISTNPIDIQHPSLYYSILRIWDIGIDGLDTKKMINRGCTLNLIFFTLSFFFMYKLLSLIRNEKKFISLGLFFAFFATGAISNTLLIREYALMETLLIASVYIFAYLSKKISDNELLTPKDFLITVITFSLFSLSGFFSNILSFMLFSILIIKSLNKNNKIQYLKFLTTAIVAIIFSVLIINPAYIHIFSNHHSDTVNSHFSNILSYNSIIYSLNILFRYLFYNIVFYILIFLFTCIFPSIKNKKLQLDRSSWQLIIITSVWVYLVLSIQPWSDDLVHILRFIAPSIPILSILLLYFTYNYNKYIQAFIVTLFFISTLQAFTEHPTPYAGNINYYNSYSEFDIKTQIPNIDSYTDKNLVIVKPKWEYVNFLLYLPNDYNVRFEDKNPNRSGKYVFDNYLLMNGQSGQLKLFDEYFTIVQKNKSLNVLNDKDEHAKMN